MVSTVSSAATTLVQSGNHFSALVVKPKVIDSYNHDMNGVDIADQHTVYYKIIVKWWMLETAMVNCYILLSQLQHQSHTYTTVAC